MPLLRQPGARRELQKVALRLSQCFEVPREADILPHGTMLAGASFTVLFKRGDRVHFSCRLGGNLYTSTMLRPGAATNNSNWG